MASALGGFFMLVGCQLPWLDTGGVNVGGQVVSGAPAGLETTAGPFVLVSGIVVLLAATLMLMVPRASKVWGLAVLLAGAVGATSTIPTLTDPREAYVQFVADDLGRDVRELENSLNALFDIGGIQADFGEGVYLSLAGGGLSVIAGAAGLVARRRRRAHVPKVVTDHRQSSAELGSEPTQAEPGTASEQAATETAQAVESEKREQPATRAAKAERQPAAPAAGKSKDKPPPPSDVDMWR